MALLLIILALLGSFSGTGKATIRLLSPVPPAGAKTFVWQVNTENNFNPRPLEQLAITGCWKATQVEKIEFTHRQTKKSTLTTLQPSKDPLFISITFKETFTSKKDGTILSYTQGLQKYRLTTAGPTCQPPQSPDPVVTLPPDPKAIAPKLASSQFTSLADATKFLYTGPNPIQTGVAAGTIDSKRAAVLRGKVNGQDGKPLSGVKVTVLKHPEFGQTLSRADGMFDMAVNGGGSLTVLYQKAGYLPVQRTVIVPWRDYKHAPEVVMTKLDPNVTAITTGSNVMQVARGGKVSDESGSRQATILFPSGATATMTLPNGTKQTMPKLNLRATEYTVGDRGPQAMPADLPPTSAYTYAAELSADEAMTVGAKTIEFSKPVPTYVDNFLGFPVGMKVPAGYYDRDQAKWIAANDGQVIKITSITGGKATVAVEKPDFIPATPQQLQRLGITDEELQKLATLYAAGTTLWRVPVQHFTPWDYNWPYGPPEDAEPPEQPDPVQEDDQEDEPCEKSGSIIECQNQVLGERVPLVGTPLSLNYRNDRQLGRKASNVMAINLTGSKISANLLRVNLVVSVAGREYNHQYNPAPNLKHEFIWDGIDAYGRKSTDPQNVTVTIQYFYRPKYLQPAEFAQSFAIPSVNRIQAGPGRQEIILTQNFEGQVFAGLGTYDERGKGLGGWSLDKHHSYNSNNQTLLMGTGDTRSTKGSVSHVITTLAGTGTSNKGDGGTGDPVVGDGGPATKSDLHSPHGVAVAPDGSVYFAENGNHRVRKVSPDGIITTIAGTGEYGFSGDGGPATQAEIAHPKGLTLGADGSLYIIDGSNARIRKISPNGIITTVAGMNDYGYSGDGGPATKAQVHDPHDIVAAPDGSLYIADTYNNRVRHIAPNGIITTIAGTGEYGFSGDGEAATKAKFREPQGLTLDRDGNLYVIDRHNHRIRKISPDGIITTIAGTGEYGFSGDGGKAIDASFEAPTHLAVGPDGGLYVSDYGGGRVRRISPDSIVTTVMGGGHSRDDGIPAMQAGLNFATGIAFGPDGSVYIAESGNEKVRKISSAFTQFSKNDITIASEDGKELYVFSAEGRHLKTLNTHTGAVINTFTYDAKGLLHTITDGDGNVTTIDHDANGNPTAITGPYGQRTQLAVDANGYLQAITNPANETTKMSYSNDGLLVTFTDAKNQTTTLTYDAYGRLLKDENAANGSWSLSRADEGWAYTTTMESALNRSTAYRVEKHWWQQVSRITDPAGNETRINQRRDGTTERTEADNTHAFAVTSPDPRFGMQSPLSKVTVKTPSGFSQTTEIKQSVFLKNASDLLSLNSLTRQTILNNKTSTLIFNADDKQYKTTSAGGREQIVTVDAQERPVRVETPGVAPQHLTYDARGRLTTIVQRAGAEERKTTITYNANGQPAQITNPTGLTELLTYDQAGRVTQKTLRGNRNAAWTYDANGNITSLTPPGKPTHTFTYTPLNKEQVYTPATVAGIAEPSTKYEYNPDNQLTKITRPGNQVSVYTYDNAGRLNTVMQPNRIITYEYSAATGQITSINDNQNLFLGFTYDGSLPVAEHWSGAVGGSVKRGYNDKFEVSSIKVNDNEINFEYDDDGLLTAAGDLSLARSAQNGKLSGTTLGLITTSQTYNAFGEMNRFTARASASQFGDIQYNHDKLGRITQKTETTNGQSATYAYEYDDAGRLRAVKKDGTLQASYTYDTNGNRLSKTTDATTAQGTYDAQDRLATYDGATYAYTDNGELKTKTKAGKTTSFAHDVHGNLTKVTLPSDDTLEYLIDGTNRRIGKKVNGTQKQGFLYQNEHNPVAELNGNNDVVARFVYGTRSNVPDYMLKNDRTYRIISDHLGSPRLVVDVANGTVAQYLEYDEFGVVTKDTNPGFQPFGFAGGLYDRDTGLVHFGQRDYDPQTGRWIQKDPIKFNGKDTNLYAYVGNDPVNAIDPTGLINYEAQRFLDSIFKPTTDTSKCATAECAAGLLPTRPDNRTQKEQDKGACRLICNMVLVPPIAACNIAVGGGLTGLLVGTAGRTGGCYWFCS